MRLCVTFYQWQVHVLCTQTYTLTRACAALNTQRLLTPHAQEGPTHTREGQGKDTDLEQGGSETVQ